jgi:hypothetical protein
VSCKSRVEPLQTQFDRLAFERENAEGALVNLAEGFATDETLQSFQVQGEFAECETTLSVHGALAEAEQMLRRVVLRRARRRHLSSRTAHQKGYHEVVSW